jgi:hypothetical protein
MVIRGWEGTVSLKEENLLQAASDKLKEHLDRPIID